MSDNEVEDAYEAYVARFDELVGPREVGQYGKWGRHLVKKYSLDEFRQRHLNYRKLERACRHIMETGATLNDAVTLAFREAAAEILLDENVFDFGPVAT